MLHSKISLIVMVISLQTIAISLTPIQVSSTITNTDFTNLSQSWYMSIKHVAFSDISTSFYSEDAYWGLYATKKQLRQEGLTLLIL